MRGRGQVSQYPSRGSDERTALAVPGCSTGKMKCLKRIHGPTFFALLVIYLACLAVLIVVPHEDPVDGIGKMEIHQIYAQSGRVASLGLIDRTLVEWILHNPTYEADMGPYNRIVLQSVVCLTPVFVTWCLLASVCVNLIRLLRLNVQLT